MIEKRTFAIDERFISEITSALRSRPLISVSIGESEEEKRIYFVVSVDNLEDGMFFVLPVVKIGSIYFIRSS